MTVCIRKISFKVPLDDICIFFIVVAYFNDIIVYSPYCSISSHHDAIVVRALCECFFQDREYPPYYIPLKYSCLKFASEYFSSFRLFRYEGIVGGRPVRSPVYGIQKIYKSLFIFHLKQNGVP